MPVIIPDDDDNIIVIPAGLRGPKGDPGTPGSSVADGVSFTPTVEIAATDVQEAIEEAVAESFRLNANNVSTGDYTMRLILTGENQGGVTIEGPGDGVVARAVGLSSSYLIFLGAGFDYAVGLVPDTASGAQALVVGFSPGEDPTPTGTLRVIDPVAPSDAVNKQTLDAHTTDTDSAHAASAVSFTPNGSIAATNVQAAIQEVRDEAVLPYLIQLFITDPAGVALTVGDGAAFFTVPLALNGMNLVSMATALTTVSSSGLPTVQIANVTQGADMLSTKCSIDAGELTSYTALTPAVIDTANDDVATGDLLRFDIDVAGTGAKGLQVILEFQLP